MIKLSAVKQRIAFAVAAVMVMGSLLTACGGEAAPTSTPAAPAPTATSAAAAPTDTTAAAAGPTNTTAAAGPTNTTSAAGPTNTTAAAGPTNTTGPKQNITLTYIASQGWIQPAEMDLAKKFEEQTGI